MQIPNDLLQIPNDKIRLLNKRRIICKLYFNPQDYTIHPLKYNKFSHKQLE